MRKNKDFLDIEPFSLAEKEEKHGVG